MELATLRQKQSEPSRIAQLYQQELKDLRSQVEELSRDKNRFLIERNNVEDELQVKPSERVAKRFRITVSFTVISCVTAEA